MGHLTGSARARGKQIGQHVAREMGSGTLCSGCPQEKGYKQCRRHGYGPDIPSIPVVYMILLIGVAVLEARKGLLL